MDPSNPIHPIHPIQSIKSNPSNPSNPRSPETAQGERRRLTNRGNQRSSRPPVNFSYHATQSGGTCDNFGDDAHLRQLKGGGGLVVVLQLQHEPRLLNGAKWYIGNENQCSTPELWRHYIKLVHLFSIFSYIGNVCQILWKVRNQ